MSDNLFEAKTAIRVSLSVLEGYNDLDKLASGFYTHQQLAFLAHDLEYLKRELTHARAMLNTL
jgi:hypothetical protein